MKLYKTSYLLTPASSGEYPAQHHEFSSSAADASKVRTRLKTLKKADIDCDFSEIETTEVDVDPTRSGLIKFLNELTAHKSWVTPAVAEKLDGQ